MQDVRAEYKYLPGEILIQVSQGLDVPLSQVYSVAAFFKAFSLKPRVRHLINLCLGTACHVRSAVRVLEKIERELRINSSETTQDLKFTLETVSCVGACGYACPTNAIAIEDIGGKRLVKWPHSQMEFKLVKCKICGSCWALEKQLEYIAKISGTSLEEYDVCPDCRD